MPDPVTTIRRLTEEDLSFADEVRRHAGWNQTPRGWRRFLALEPEGCFLAECQGQPAGTATTTCYGRELAWIGMVLVHPDFRRRGVGTALLRHCIRYLQEERQIGCIKLDATPEGQPLYEKLGFRAEWGLKRWRLERRSGNEADIYPNKPSKDPLSEEHLAMDRKVFGADRAKLLRSLWEGSVAAVSDRPGARLGFGLLREGARASYLGPVTSLDAMGAEILISQLLSLAPPGEVFWDIPDENPVAVRLAQSQGFHPVRVLTRMYLGEANVEGQPSAMYAIAEPALG